MKTIKETNRERYLLERARRMIIRKAERKERRKNRKEVYRKLKSSECRGCGEDPYCYCGSGTPGVIDY